MNSDLDVGVDVGNSSTRFPNFTEAEDVFLCSTWSNATNDPIVGVLQKGDAFWLKAHTYWMHHKKENYSNRTPDGLMQRFSKIKTEVSKFCGYVSQIGYTSGHTIDDKIAKAKEMFTKLETKPKARKPVEFAFEHCWKVLQYDQKWLETGTKKKPKHPNVPSNSSSPVYISVDGEDTPKSDERPVGRKLAKEGRTKRKGKFVYDSSSILEKIDQTVTLNEKHHNDDAAMFIESDKKMEAYLEMEKEKLEIERENLGIKKRKITMETQMFDVELALKEAEFMNKDIASLTDPGQVVFYQAMQKKIREKYQAM